MTMNNDDERAMPMLETMDDGEMTNNFLLRPVPFELAPSMAKGRSKCDVCTHVVQFVIRNTEQCGIFTITRQIHQSVPAIVSVACALLALKKACINDAIGTANEPPLQAAYTLLTGQRLVGYTYGYVFLATFPRDVARIIVPAAFYTVADVGATTESLGDLHYAVLFQDTMFRPGPGHCGGCFRWGWRWRWRCGGRRWKHGGWFWRWR